MSKGYCGCGNPMCAARGVQPDPPAAPVAADLAARYTVEAAAAREGISLDPHNAENEAYVRKLGGKYDKIASAFRDSALRQLAMQAVGFPSSQQAQEQTAVMVAMAVGMRRRLESVVRSVYAATGYDLSDGLGLHEPEHPVGDEDILQFAHRDETGESPATRLEKMFGPDGFKVAVKILAQLQG